MAKAIEEAFDDSWVEMEVPVHAIPRGQNWTELRDTLIVRCRETIGFVGAFTRTC
jgi:hypothetical protein